MAGKPTQEQEQQERIRAGEEARREETETAKGKGKKGGKSAIQALGGSTRELVGLARGAGSESSVNSKATPWGASI